MKVMTDETFGPVIPVMKVSDAEEALRLANDTTYGLSGSVMTRDFRRGEEIARRMEAGAINVDDVLTNYLTLEVPMGGWKSSGIGSRHSVHGIRKFTQDRVDRLAPLPAGQGGPALVPALAAQAEAHQPDLPVLRRARLAQPARRSSRRSRSQLPAQAVGLLAVPVGHRSHPLRLGLGPGRRRSASNRFACELSGLRTRPSIRRASSSRFARLPPPIRDSGVGAQA